ncbi:MAG: hypothetical protein AAF627_12465 [Myxococcota bacterium]
MNLKQRRVHSAVWLVLGPVALLLLYMALQTQVRPAAERKGVAGEAMR